MEKKYKIRLLRNCLVDGSAIRYGTEIRASAEAARDLIRRGWAEALEEIPPADRPTFTVVLEPEAETAQLKPVKAKPATKAPRRKGGGAK